MKFLLLAGIHSALTPSSEDWMWGTSGRFGCFLTGGLRWPSGAAEEARVSNSAVCFNPKLIQLLRREKSRDGRTSWQRQMELDAVLSVNTAPTLPLEVSTARGWSLFCSSSEGRLSYLRAAPRLTRFHPDRITLTRSSSGDRFLFTTRLKSCSPDTSWRLGAHSGSTSRKLLESVDAFKTNLKLHCYIFLFLFCVSVAVEVQSDCSE